MQAFNSALASFDASGLDGNGDGFIDNVLVIPEVGDNAPTTASAAYPRQMEYGGSLFVGSGTRAVLVRSYTVVDTSHLISTGTIVHETLHTFGAKDLHRSQALSSANHAVGVWDIMAARNESRLMRPLAITLQDSGWREIEVVAPGTYTIAAPGSAERSAVRFSSGLSGTEYFVAEFRKANSDTSDLSALDTTTGEILLQPSGASAWWCIALTLPCASMATRYRGPMVKKNTSIFSGVGRRRALACAVMVLGICAMSSFL